MIRHLAGLAGASAATALVATLLGNLGPVGIAIGLAACVSVIAVEIGKDRRAADFSGVDRARDIMAMPWANRDGLREAIPPAYTEHIGHQLLAALLVTEPMDSDK